MATEHTDTTPDSPVEPGPLDTPDPGPVSTWTLAAAVSVAAYVGDAEVQADLPAGPVPADLPDALLAHLVAIGAATPIAPAQPEE